MPKPTTKRRTGVRADAEWSYHWDLHSNAEYISVGKEIGVARTVELREGLLLDLNKKGEVIGVEILGPLPNKKNHGKND